MLNLGSVGRGAWAYVLAVAVLWVLALWGLASGYNPF